MCVIDVSSQAPTHYSRRLSTAAEAFSMGVTLLSYRSNRAPDQPLLLQSQCGDLQPSLRVRSDSTSAISLSMAAVTAAALPLRQVSAHLSPRPTDRQSVDTESLLDLLARAQESRLNEQRCDLPKHLQVRDRLPSGSCASSICGTSGSGHRSSTCSSSNGSSGSDRLQQQQQQPFRRRLALRTRSAPGGQLLQHGWQATIGCSLQNSAAAEHSPPGTARRLTSAQPPQSPLLQQPASPDVDRLLSLLRGPGPYPMVIVPSAGGYWAEGFTEEAGVSHKLNTKRGLLQSRRDTDSDTIDADDLEADDSCNHYKEHFAGQEHLNYLANDDAYGPVVLSLKKCPLGPGCQDVAHAIVRTRVRTAHCILALDGDDSCHEPSIASLAKACCDELTTSRFYPITFLGASKLISEYDERFVCKQFKFGIIYQKFGQVMEEDMFGNRGSSPAFEEFLNLLGNRIALQGFEGFRGGLDTQLGQTGRESVYTRYQDRELMFHVSTLLPYADGDSQQVQRKRHIGNDIVTIVFQEANTPFIPNAIASQFLHAYIVVQPITTESGEAAYKVSVSARSDVPRFGPKLRAPAVYRKDEHFRNFLLTKLLNAEYACQKASQFSHKLERTRMAYLTDLHTELFRRTAEAMFASDQLQQHHHEKSGSFLGSIKKLALRKGTASESLLRKVDPHANKDHKGAKKSSVQSMRDISTTTSGGGSSVNAAAVSRMLRTGSSWDEKLAAAAFAHSRQTTSLQSIVLQPAPLGKNSAAGRDGGAPATPLLSSKRSTSLLKLPGASSALSAASLECSGYDDCTLSSSASPSSSSSSASSSPRIPLKAANVGTGSAKAAAVAAGHDWCGSPSPVGSLGAGSSSAPECDDCFHHYYDSDTGIASLSPAITPCSTLDSARRRCHSGIGSSEKLSSMPGHADPADVASLKREMLELKHNMSTLQTENSALRKELHRYSEKGDCCVCPRCTSYRKLSSSYASTPDATVQDDSIGSEVEHHATDPKSQAASGTSRPDLKKLYALAGMEEAIV